MPDAGFELETVRILGFDRDAPWKNLALPYLIPTAVVAARRILDRFRPNVVLGMGGYVMAPALAAARMRGIPYVLHEKDVRPGLATRYFAAGAAAVCTTLPGTEQRLHRSVILTGVPLREGFRLRTPDVPPRRLLVTGGSQGARRLNEAVWAAIGSLTARFEEVIHVAGRQGEEGVARHAGTPRYTGLTFTDDMASLMARADLVVSRAGVSTIAEAAAVGLPMILIPGTFGGGHQEENASAIVDAGAAVRIQDGDLSADSLLAKVDSLDADRLRSMAIASQSLGRRDAARRVLAVLRDAAGKQ